ncbi:hypothetical protein [Sodalis sp. RH23]|uniref:hypothetical protein n=1 Tax=unclassified Sodalis (in: enterobacteria) TaxID=2636512 RepID=UPI0039B58385
MTSPRFEPDAHLLCGYGQALARWLVERRLSPDSDKNAGSVFAQRFSAGPQGEPQG